MYRITSESQLIEKAKILDITDNYKIYINHLSKIGDDLIEMSELCDKNALYIDEITMDVQISETGSYIKERVQKLLNQAEQIEKEVNSIYNEQYGELINYLKSLNKD
ncbi:MAG: hypothetical protein IJ842_02155 [Bacilli bacterium]|nr:hypothetical protein [Bacilli bacterium]